MKLPFVSRDRFDILERSMAEMRQLSAEQMIAEQRRYEALLDKYHALRVAGADPAPTYATPEPSTPFGPLTRAALSDMGVGQAGSVKRAMKDKALSVWLENRHSPENQDELTAIAVRQGETRR